MGAGRTPSRRPWLSLLVAATFSVVLLAATAGTVGLATEGCCAWTWDVWSEGGEPTVQPPEPGDGQPAASDPVGADMVELIARIVVVILVSAVAYLIGRFLWRTVRAVSIEHRTDPGDWEVAAPTGRDELVEAVDEGLAELQTGPVGDTIVACWVRLENGVAEAGVARAPWETPAELTARVLDRLAVPTAATLRLLALYRTARYSQHTLGEPARVEALQALGEIRQALAVVGAP